jgi:Fe-S-cluster-containing hydrogenase component 2
MSDRQTPWVDLSRCIGCATCIDVCPVDAISMLNDKAHIDDEICTGCGACVDACPNAAVQFVVEGAVVPVWERSLPATLQPGPVTDITGATAAGTILLREAVTSLVREVFRRLTRRSAAGHAERSGAEASVGVAGNSGGRAGRRVRHRRRGH